MPLTSIAVRMRSHDIGRRGESTAADFLTERGWTVIARNYRAGSRELDLVVRRGRTVAFVEVKARSDSTHGHPFEAIDWRKRRDLAHAARRWIAEHGTAGDLYRFDAIAVHTGPGHLPPRIEHLEDAWRIE